MKDPNETVLWVMEETGEIEEDNGKVRKTGVWKIAEKNVSLGSLEKPNREILQVKYAKRGLQLGGLFF